MKRTNEQLIAEAKKMVSGSDFKVKRMSREFTDERGFPRKINFTAVTFTGQDGQSKYISESFI